MSILIEGLDLPKIGDSYLLQIAADGSIYDAFGRRTYFVASYVPPQGEHHDPDGCWNCEHCAIPVAWCALDKDVFAVMSCKNWKKKKAIEAEGE